MLHESNGFAFLQNKVQTIQESDAKYKRPATRKRRVASDQAKPTAKKRQTMKTTAEPAATAIAPAIQCQAKAPVIQEDDDYDESDSE